jgi:hypothetical protein
LRLEHFYGLDVDVAVGDHKAVASGQWLVTPYPIMAVDHKMNSPVWILATSH